LQQDPSKEEDRFVHAVALLVDHSFQRTRKETLDRATRNILAFGETMKRLIMPVPREALTKMSKTYLRRPDPTAAISKANL